MKRLLALVLPAFLAGCPNTDPAVFVDASVREPQVEVLGGGVGSLAAEVKGSFFLDLHLGPRAADPSEVSIGVFEIVTGEDKNPVYSPLPVESDTPFPVTVDLDSTVTVLFTFDAEAPLETGEEICGAPGLSIKGALEDSLRGSTTAVFSATFDPSGC